MDVEPGHCWLCEKILPKHTLPCRRCPMAVYCSAQCRGKDSIRHGAVECQMFAPEEKMCSACGKLGKTLACSACCCAWYCNKDCQRRNFQAHKNACQGNLAFIKQISVNLNKFRIQSYGDFPEYFGNTMATDFLRLENNEWSGASVGEKQLDRDYHVLSAGCGDLRNTVFTAASLPTEYLGKLHVTLNDQDPFVMARNVLFLFISVQFADADDIASNLTTIWYSLHISKREYGLIETSLGELLQMSARQLNDATKGLVSVLDEELGHLRHVWRGWQLQKCQRDNQTSINLRQQRKNWFENSNQIMKDDRSEYLKCLSASDRNQMEKWFEHGLFLPRDVDQRDIPFDNPTLTATEASKNVALFDSPSPHLPVQASGSPNEDDMFAYRNYRYRYLMSLKRMPFTVWDCLRVKEHIPGSRSSWMVMYHKYVTDLLQKFLSFIHQGRLLICVSLTSCLNFPQHHQALQMPSYDRIFTSNIADYVGLAKLLQTFKPLLNSSNRSSVLVTEIMLFYINVPGSSPLYLPEPQRRIVTGYYTRDFQTTGDVTPNLFKLFDYCNDTLFFLMYLRADIMAGGLGIPAQKDVPSFNSVKKCQGMQMRDFRKELNKLVPFQHRLNVRSLTSPNPGDRAVEWLLPNTM